MEMHVVIIGGGIAGPAVGIALRKAGHETTVFEAYPTLAAEVGYFLTVAGNGLDALSVLGADVEVRAAAFPTPQMVFRNGAGKVLGRLDNGGAAADGTPSQTIKRADLYRALHDEAERAGVRFAYGHRLASIETGAGGAPVTAQFTDGSEATGDLLVGADGLHSVTRTWLDPAAPRPRYVPILNTGGYARGVPVDAEPGVFTMVFGRRAFFGYTVHPSGEVWWFANPPHLEEPTAAKLAALNDGDRWRHLLLDLFADDATPAAELIKRTRHELTGWATYDMPRVETWHRGRVVLTGDAAHATSPSSGQGASMAIEDAVVLGKCLRDIPDVDRALDAYVGIRRARVERVVAAGARGSSMKVAGPVGRVVRDLTMPIVLKQVARHVRQEWMYGYHIDWDEPIRAAV
jgi:2-polyprenyl-6-methoxyphenol hydroxylase-like FAD-dependent oxidoreductase